MNEDISTWLPYIRFVAVNYLIFVKVNGTFTMVNVRGFLCSVDFCGSEISEYFPTLLSYTYSLM
jgi:hypothetical protein